MNNNTAGNKTMMNLQDSFLNHVRKENLPVVIYLVNGFQIRGLVRGFDNFKMTASSSWFISMLFPPFPRLPILPSCSQRKQISRSNAAVQKRNSA